VERAALSLATPLFAVQEITSLSRHMSCVWLHLKTAA